MCMRVERRGLFLFFADGVWIFQTFFGFWVLWKRERIHVCVCVCVCMCKLILFLGGGWRCGRSPVDGLGVNFHLIFLLFLVEESPAALSSSNFENSTAPSPTAVSQEFPLFLLSSRVHKLHKKNPIEI